jgi:hypothetical protein
MTRLTFNILLYYSYVQFLTFNITMEIGILKGCPNMTEKLILKYLNPSPATAKGQLTLMLALALMPALMQMW